MISTIVNNDTTNLKLDQSSLQDIPFFIRKGKKKAKVKKKDKKETKRKGTVAFLSFFLRFVFPFFGKNNVEGRSGILITRYDVFNSH